MKMYEVGGVVRDEFLGVKSKDIDFSCVLEQSDIDAYTAHNKFTPYEYMVFYLEGLGVKIFKNNDNVPIGAEFLTARGVAPKDFPNHPGMAVDFVLARKESGYSDGRRPDQVEPGSLMDDLARRDFTINAVAKDENGEIIDPFGGIMDIRMRRIRAVGDPVERLAEDALRAVRALRFAVTKSFIIDSELTKAMESFEVWNAVKHNVSDERIQIEVDKMFAFSTIDSMIVMQNFPALRNAIFAGSVSLTATMKKRK